MNSGKIVAGGQDGWTDRGSIRGPHGPKNMKQTKHVMILFCHFGHLSAGLIVENILGECCIMFKTFHEGVVSWLISITFLIIRKKQNMETGPRSIW